MTAAEWNEVPSEIQNVIEGLGITLSGGDLNQLGKAIAGYVANGVFYTDSGAADAYVLSVIGLKQAPTAYTDGFQIRFVPGNTNTGASTANVSGLGVKSITLDDGSVLVGGEIVVGETIHCEFDSGADKFRLIPQLTNVNIAKLKSGRKNLLRGNFFINQRVVSGSVVLTVGNYGHDYFRAGAAGCTYTFAISAGVTIATITAGSLEQLISGEDIATGSHVASWPGTAQAQIDGGGFGDSGEVTATLTSGTDAVIEFGTGTVSLPQLELGTVATEYERRKKTVELILCLPRFQKSFEETAAIGADAPVDYMDSVLYGTASTFVAERKVRFPVPMEGNPTVVTLDDAGNTAKVSYFSGSGASVSSNQTGSVAKVSPVGFRVQSDAVTSKTGMLFNWTAEFKP